MNLSLSAISPLDGRYHQKLQPLQSYFSESALQRYRLLIEIQWLFCLSEHPQISEVPLFLPGDRAFLEKIIDEFSLADSTEIKNLEQSTNHDVKAVEYFLKNKISTHPRLKSVIPFIHFACTSEDINNLSYGLMLKEARDQILLPLMGDLIEHLTNLARKYHDLPMLARTHGQAASPTTLGKELSNFAIRLSHPFKQLSSLPIYGKFNGAVGNYNAHLITYPDINWIEVTENFVHQLGLNPNLYTTQIEPHDYLAEFFQILQRFNVICLDLARDIWGYIALEYFKLKIIKDEVGSSTMPHKINPIDFENAEGNLGIANSLQEFFIRQLPISRWQRDLSDSTVLRNMGVSLGHSYLAYHSLLKGLNKLAVHEEKIRMDLNQQWAVLSEAIQTVMRRYQIPDAYEQLKNLSRGKTINSESFTAFIKDLKLPEAVKQNLLALTPYNYIGLASKLTLAAITEIELNMNNTKHISI